MRLWVFSDLHRDAGGRPWTPSVIPQADVAMVAGDVAEGLVDTVGWLAQTVRPHMPVILVAGNHEYYRRSLPDELARGRKAAALQGVNLLEDDTVEVGGCLFSGCTLWTNYDLYGEDTRQAAMHAARDGMNDHRAVTWEKRPVWKRFRPEEALRLHESSMRFLESALGGSRPRPTPHVVVTHHAPSPKSIAPQYESDPLNPAFVSDLDHFVRRAAPSLWVHGHVHSSFDYRIGTTRIVCNPKGYGRENPDFDPTLVVELAA